MSAVLKPRELPSLWEHQARDIEFCMSTPEVFNTSDPGTGKTRVCIETIKRLGLPAVITAPKSILAAAWGEDIEKYSNLSYAIAYASNREEAFRSGAQVVITNHDAATAIAEHPEWLAPYKDGLLINDECRVYKNPNSLRSRAIDQIRPKFSRCIGMTGTPNANGLLDLWHQLFVIDQGARLGPHFYKFRSTVCEGKRHPQGFIEWSEKPGMADAVASLIGDITIRNRREDCMDLPPNQTTTRHFELSPAHRRLYEKMKRETVLELEGGVVNAVNRAVLLGKLLQICSGAVYDAGGGYQDISSDRYDLVMDLVEEREHSVVFFNWRHQKERVIELAKKRKMSFAVIDGEASEKARAQAVVDFQAGHLQMLLCHWRAAGHGLTLTRGQATIWISPTYDAEGYEQACARIWRGGQTRETETILIEAVDTIERDVYAKLQAKRLNMHHLLDLLRG